jgi:hypothetical protein
VITTKIRTEEDGRITAAFVRNGSLVQNSAAIEQGRLWRPIRP